MSDLRIVKGNDFATLYTIRAMYADGTIVEDFDLRACTDVQVIVHRTYSKSVASLLSANEYGSYSLEPENVLRINWDGLLVKLGTYTVDFRAKFRGADIRSYSIKDLIFDIVETNEEANIPAGAFVDNGVYVFSGDFVLMFESQVQADWDESDTSSPAYIKNKPTIPDEVTEQTVADWGFTKNTGDYTKPVDGIPLSDLDAGVQSSLEKADTAYQKPNTGIPASDIASGVIPDVSQFITRNVDDLVNYTTTANLNTLLAGKQDKLTFDNIPTQNSNNPVKSGGIYSVINSLKSAGYVFAGVATPSTSPGTPTEKVFYIGGAGTYANFGTSVTVPVGSVCVFKYNGSWTKEQVKLFDGIDTTPTANSTNLVESGGLATLFNEIDERAAEDKLVNLIDYGGLKFESGSFNVGTGAESSNENRIRNIGILETPLSIKVPDGFLIKFVLYYTSWTSPSSYTFAVAASPNSQYYKMGTTYPYARIVIGNSANSVITPSDLYNALPLVTNKINEVNSELDEKADASSLLDESINIFDGETIVGRTINGVTDNTSSYRTTKNLVPVEYGKTYYCTGKQASGIRRGIGRYVSFYDENGALISQSSPSLDSQYYTANDESVKYIRWCWKPTDFGWTSSDADMEVMIYAGGVDAAMITPDNTSAYVLYQAEYSPKGFLDYLPFLYQKKGAKIVSFGDSITDFGFYPEFACKMISAISYNMGFGGCRMAKTNNGNYEPFSMEALAESIVSGDFSAAHAAASALSKPDWDAKITTLENLDFSTVKAITIEYGVNDFSSSIPINTVKTAVANIITMLKTAYKGLQIIFIPPMYRRYGANNEYDSDTYENNNGDILPDMVAAIEEVAKANHIEYLDLYYTMGVNAQSWQYYLQDGTHPMYNGYREIGKRLGGYLLTH